MSGVAGTPVIELTASEVDDHPPVDHDADDDRLQPVLGHRLLGDAGDAGGLVFGSA